MDKTCLVVLYLLNIAAPKETDTEYAIMHFSAFHLVLYFQSFCDCEEDDMLVCLRFIMCARLTPLEVLDQLVDVVDALACQGAGRRPSAVWHCNQKNNKILQTP